MATFRNGKLVNLQTLNYSFPSTDGNLDESFYTDGSGALTFEKNNLYEVASETPSGNPAALDMLIPEGYDKIHVQMVGTGGTAFSYPILSFFSDDTFTTKINAKYAKTNASGTFYTDGVDVFGNTAGEAGSGKWAVVTLFNNTMTSLVPFQGLFRNNASYYVLYGTLNNKARGVRLYNGTGNLADGGTMKIFVGR